MNTNWKYNKLSDLCAKIGDGLHGTPTYSKNTGYFFVNGNNLKGGKIEINSNTKSISKNEFEKYFIELNRNTLLLGINGSIGNTAFYRDEKIILGKSIAYLNFKSDINKFYYYYFQLNEIKKYFYDVATGSTIKNLSLKSIQDFKVPVPDVREYRSITSVLEKIDQKIEINNKINSELEKMAKLIYDYWFVQFDFPDENGKPYKSSGGKMEWSETLRREIPNNWKEGVLGDISNLIRGVSYDKSEIKNEFEEDAIPILRATNISGNVIDFNNMVFVPSQNVSANQYLNTYDILITMSSGSKDHIGKNAFYYSDKKVSFGAFCAKIVPNDNFHFYLYSYTQSDFMFATIKNECLGTNINNLNSTIVNSFRIVIPDEFVIEQFNKKVSSIYKMIGVNLNENILLTQLRDWLLPMLMNEQVKIV